MPRLLIVHHITSPSMQSMYEAVLSGATDEKIKGVEVFQRAALTANALDVLEGDAYILGTPANIGYMSGALKHFFDQIYYPCLAATVRRPYGVFVHGNNDTGGAIRSIEIIATGLQWNLLREPVSVIGSPVKSQIETCWELGASAAARLATGLA